MNPIRNFEKWLTGSSPLPAGAVPLAGENGGLVCLMPTGRWILWLGGVSSSKPDETQKAVMETVVGQLGGTAESTAEALGVSRRTVEAWRSGRARLPIRSAYAIAEKLGVK